MVEPISDPDPAAGEPDFADEHAAMWSTMTTRARTPTAKRRARPDTLGSSPPTDRMNGVLPDQAGGLMATTKQTQAARRNVTRAQKAAAGQKTIANMPKATRTALGKQGAAVARRKRTGGSSPKTRAELYEMAKKRGLAGRSSMGRDELARALGEH